MIRTRMLLLEEDKFFSSEGRTVEGVASRYVSRAPWTKAILAIARTVLARITRCYAAVAIIVILASSANGEVTFIETFEDSSNVGQWTFGNDYEQIEDTGGNPGAFLYNYNLITFSPMATAKDSIFVGDYRANQVTSVGIDFITFYYDLLPNPVSASVMLLNTGEDPNDGSDNWGAYCLNPLNEPAMGEGWISYDYEIPSQATSLPDGWSFISYGPDSPTNPDWNDLITDVTYLYFTYRDPSQYYLIGGWAVGMDNPRITFVAKPVPGDVNGDGWVDGADLSLIISHWGQSGLGWSGGDLNDNGVVDGPDYTEVLSYWGTGSAPPPEAIPEPATLGLMLLGGLAMVIRKRK